MSKKQGPPRRADYQPPQRKASAAVPVAPEGVAAPRRSRQSWGPLLGSAALVLFLITLVVLSALAGSGSDPGPARPTPTPTASR